MLVAVVSVLCLVVGASAGWLAAMSLARRRRRSARAEIAGTPQRLPEGAVDVIAVLRSVTIVLDPSDEVVRSAPSAAALGLVRGRSLAHEELRFLAREVRRDGVVREAELELPRGPLGEGRVSLSVRVAPLRADLVLLLIEDETHSRRVEETRRDFVVNVSHELKTPVGGLSLLAEAVEDARDDPEAVARFAGRMRGETQRLAQLVGEIVELSRLQVGDTLVEPELVDVNGCVAAALDHAGVMAEDREVELVAGPDPRQPQVYGDGELITTAVRNLITNAVNYSDRRTRVAATVRQVGDLVEIAVADQGSGIPEAEQSRIFERFYRVDAARSRATGGTGLGLAIVKHVSMNHGGDVTVWSEEGHGSTFTIRLPVANDGGPTAAPPSQNITEDRR